MAPPPVPPVTGPTELVDPTLASADATRATPSTTGFAPPMPAAPPPPSRSAARSPAQPSDRRRRWGLILTLTLVVAASVIAIVLALQAGGDDDPDGGFDRETTGGNAGLVVTSFDPEGDDGDENTDLAPLAVDGDPTTAWRSSCYASSTFGGLKEGVGLVVALGSRVGVDGVEVEAAPTGWSASVHVADQAGETLADWGPEVGAVTDADGAATIDLDGAEGSFVLVFFTGLGTDASPQCQNFPFGLSVSELAIDGG
jgi:putative peptidoglycan lipid II flippase